MCLQVLSASRHDAPNMDPASKVGGQMPVGAELQPLLPTTPCGRISYGQFAEGWVCHVSYSTCALSGLRLFFFPFRASCGVRPDTGVGAGRW